MLNDEILKLIESISPHAREYVYNSFLDNNVEVLFSILTEQNKGVFLKADNDDCCIFYASFLNEDNIEGVLDVIKNKVSEYISQSNQKELCFNIHGNNAKIINLAKELGFITDMAGYHMEYIVKQLPYLDNINLINKGFQSNMLNEFADLFDSAYYQLSIDNGWITDYYAMNKEKFHQDLNVLNKANQVRSFWLSDELVGAYIFEQNYITDIVVKPMFQDKGYGSYILSHCIRNMSVNKSVKNIRLRVSKSNVGARKLYERNDFIEIACFAEHTYQQEA